VTGLIVEEILFTLLPVLALLFGMTPSSALDIDTPKFRGKGDRPIHFCDLEKVFRSPKESVEELEPRLFLSIQIIMMNSQRVP
jgi:hypothetical protein